jgi:Zn-finger protein
VERWEDEKEMETILPRQNNLIQDSDRNEENGYLVQDSNKTKVNDTKESNNDHRNTLKEEILQVITEFHRDVNNMVNQNIQEALKNFKTPK